MNTPQARAAAIANLLDECEARLSALESKASATPSAPPGAKTFKENRSVNQETSTKARNKNREANQAAVELLVAEYPQAFSVEAPKPLKIGIQEELVADEKVSRGKIKRALATYVRSPRYLHALVEGADRVDLTGQPSGKVSADEEAHAKAKLQEYKQRRIERQKEQRKQQRVAEKEERISNKLEALVAKTNRR